MPLTPSLGKCLPVSPLGSEIDCALPAAQRLDNGIFDPPGRGCPILKLAGLEPVASNAFFMQLTKDWRIKSWPSECMNKGPGRESLDQRFWDKLDTRQTSDWEQPRKISTPWQFCSVLS